MESAKKNAIPCFFLLTFTRYLGIVLPMDSVVLDSNLEDDKMLKTLTIKGLAKAIKETTDFIESDAPEAEKVPALEWLKEINSSWTQKDVTVWERENGTYYRTATWTQKDIDDAVAKAIEVIG